MSELSIDVQASAGSDIPGAVIPEMVSLADKLGILVVADLNGVKTIAQPGDAIIHLQVAWHKASQSQQKYKIAVARQGKEIMERP